MPQTQDPTMSELDEAAVSFNGRALKRCRKEDGDENEKTFVMVKDPDGDDEVHLFQVPLAFVTAIEASGKVDKSRGAVIFIEGAADVAAAVNSLVNLPSLDEKADSCDEGEDDDGDLCDDESLRVLVDKCKRVPLIPRRSNMVYLEILNQ